MLACPLKIKTRHAEDEAEAILTDQGIELRSKYGGALTYSYRDVSDVVAEDYKVILVIGDERLELYHLGRKYDDFVRILIRQRNEMILSDLLMKERVLRAGISAACTMVLDSEITQLGNCELRLCNTALLIIPEYHDPVRVLFSFISNVREDGYTLHISAETGATYALSKLGREFSSFTAELSQAMNELSAKAQALIRDLTPTAAPAALHQAAQLMWEGKAVKRRDLEKIDPAMWKGLERQLDSVGIRPEYLFLNSLANTDQQCIGFKRELVALANTEYIWFLIPIVASNAIVMEATSGPQAARATYFFRIAPRTMFSRLGSQELQDLADIALTEINHCMLAINFRREPIYLSDERLLEPKSIKYRQAVARIPELKELRQRFIGRIFHRDPQQWENEVRDLLRFNISITDDASKWTKADLDTPEEADSQREDIGNGGGGEEW